MGYLPALARHNLSGHLGYNDHNYIKIPNGDNAN